MTRSANATDYRIWVLDRTTGTPFIENKTAAELFGDGTATTLAYPADPTHEIEIVAAAWNSQLATFNGGTGDWDNPAGVIYANLLHTGSPVAGEGTALRAVQRPDCPA